MRLQNLGFGHKNRFSRREHDNHILHKGSLVLFCIFFVFILSAHFATIITRSSGDRTKYWCSFALEYLNIYLDVFFSVILFLSASRTRKRSFYSYTKHAPIRTTRHQGNIIIQSMSWIEYEWSQLLTFWFQEGRRGPEVMFETVKHWLFSGIG